jgi:hypothetical protein
MRHRSLALTIAFLASITGCPPPPEGNGGPAANGEPGNPGPAQSGEAGAPGGPSAATPSPPGAPGGPDAGSTAPPPGGGNDGAEIGAPSPPKAPVGFASLIKGGKSVTISGKISGAKSVQIDFTATSTINGEIAPDIIQIETSPDGKFSVQAPATYDRDIYIVALAPATAGKPGPDDPGGVYGPIKLEGKNVSVEMTLSKDAEWRKEMPWYRPGDGGPAEPPSAAPEGGEAGPPPTGAPTAPK